MNLLIMSLHPIPEKEDNAIWRTCAETQLLTEFTLVERDGINTGKKDGKIRFLLNAHSKTPSHGLIMNDL